MEGATTENGPLNLFSIKESCSGPQCDYTGDLYANPYAWNAHANLLFLDQPRNVGYSFGYGTQVRSSVEAAADVITFYNNWLTYFPEFKGRQLIISGESYAGHYIPAWSNAILDFNAQPANSANRINLAGLVIGNGCVNDAVQNTAQYVKFQHAENLIPASSNPATQAAAQVAMNNYLGYTPNYYDYRIHSISCTGCYGYNYSAWGAWFLRTDVLTALNVCGDAGVDAFSGGAGGCNSMGAFDSNDKFDYSKALGRTLDAGIPVTLYYGKTDTACNYMGGLAMADGIPWTGASTFKTLPLLPMTAGGVTMGETKNFGGLVFQQVAAAGHMVPVDQPVASSMAIDSIVRKLLAKAKAAASASME